MNVALTKARRSRENLGRLTVNLEYERPMKGATWHLAMESIRYNLEDRKDIKITGVYSIEDDVVEYSVEPTTLREIHARVFWKF